MFDSELLSALIWITAFVLAAYVLGVGAYRAFEKAGVPGWIAFVPVLNLYALVRMADRPGWWALAIWFVPILGVVLWLVVAVDVAVRFGKDAFYGVAMAVPFLTPFLLARIGHGAAEFDSETDLRWA